MCEKRLDHASPPGASLVAPRRAVGRAWRVTQNDAPTTHYEAAARNSEKWMPPQPGSCIPPNLLVYVLVLVFSEHKKNNKIN
jgi:hypothetical protein